jgi:hypothetical protein
MNYQSCYPNWQYSLLKIPALELIQQELALVFHQLVKSEPAGVAFITLNSDHCEWHQLTNLNQWLESVGLGTGKWKTSYFSISNNGDACPIHVDYAEDVNFLTINIPLINCKDSYTVWYNTDIDYNLPVKETAFNDTVNRLLIYDEASKHEKSSRCGFWCSQDNAIELNRVECVSPMLANVSLPHRPIINHAQLRVLFSLRIRPELTIEEIVRLGIASPYTQTD